MINNKRIEEFEKNEHTKIILDYRDLLIEQFKLPNLNLPVPLAKLTVQYVCLKS